MGGFGRGGLIALGAGGAALTEGLEQGKEIARVRAQRDAEDAASAGALSQFASQTPDALRSKLKGIMAINEPAAIGTVPGVTAAAPDPSGALPLPAGMDPRRGMGPHLPSGLPALPGSPAVEDLPGPIPSTDSPALTPRPARDPGAEVAPTNASPADPAAVATSGGGALPPQIPVAGMAVAPIGTAPAVVPTPEQVPTSPIPEAVESSPLAAPAGVASAVAPTRGLVSGMAPHELMMNNHLDDLGRLQGGINQALTAIPYPKGSAEWNRAAAVIYKSNAPQIESWRNQLTQHVSNAAQTRGQMVLSRALSEARQGRTDAAADLLNANGVNGEIFRGTTFDGNSLVMKDGKTRIEMPEILMNSGLLNSKDAMTISAQLHHYDSYLAGQKIKAQTTADYKKYATDMRYGIHGSEDRRAEKRLEGVLATVDGRKVVAGIYTANRTKNILATIGNREEQFAEFVQQGMDAGLSEDVAKATSHDIVFNQGRQTRAAEANEAKQVLQNSKPLRKGDKPSPAPLAKKKPNATSTATGSVED